MAEGALSIKLRCASWQQLATIYRRDLSHGTMFLRAATPPPVGTAVRIDLTLPSATVITLEGVVGSHMQDPQRGSGVELTLSPIPASSVWLIESALASEHKRLATPFRGSPIVVPQVTNLIPTISENAEVTAAEQELVKALVSEAESLKKLNPFLVLGVGYEANDADVRAAFGELTKRYHPDRFARYESAELRQLAAEIFILIRDAYRRLGDTAARTLVLHSLGKPAPAPRALPGPPRRPQSVPPPRSTQRVPVPPPIPGVPNAPAAPVMTVPVPAVIRPPAAAVPAPANPPASAPVVPTAKTVPLPTIPAAPTAPAMTAPHAAPVAPTMTAAAPAVIQPAEPHPAPARRPTADPSPEPRAAPARRPTADPSPEPRAAPARRPTADPSPEPRAAPARRPTADPSPPPRGDRRPTPSQSGPLAAAADLPEIPGLEQLVDQGRLDEALAGYRLLAKRHASDRNVRAGVELCEGLLALVARDRLEAAQRFETVLEIDPSNERAARELADMRRQATNERKGLLSRLMGKKEP